MQTGRQHHSFKDLTGQRFGMLTAIRPSHSDGKHWHWEFQCDCGNTTVKSGKGVTKYVKKGLTPNCGCLQKKLNRENSTKHGMSAHPAYWVWRSMRDRCRLPTHQAWKNYGGRGITVCERWDQSFEAFWEDVGPTYEPGLTLDRINNDEGYTPENCRWVSCKAQARNRRTSLEIDVPALAKRTGISKSTLYYRLKHGWTVDELLKTPAYDNRSMTSLSAAPATGS